MDIVWDSASVPCTICGATSSVQAVNAGPAIHQISEITTKSINRPDVLYLICSTQHLPSYILPLAGFNVCQSLFFGRLARQGVYQEYSSCQGSASLSQTYQYNRLFWDTNWTFQAAENQVSPQAPLRSTYGYKCLIDLKRVSGTNYWTGLINYVMSFLCYFFPERAITYSRYKNWTTVKYFIACHPSGAIT